MKIARVDVHVLDHALEQPFESAAMRFERRQHCLVEVTCEDGTRGFGECLGPAVPNAAVVRAYADTLPGRNALETEKIWIDLYHRLRDQGQRGLALTALSGIDIALWDIKGKFFEAPISVLLGGRFRDRVVAYATGSFRKDDVDPVADIAAEVAGYVREGFHAVKIKIGFDVEQDLEVIAAARDAIGSKIRLMIDANHGYDAVAAIDVGRRAAAMNIDWFEEPVLPEQLEAYRTVRTGQPIPVAGGETWHGRWGMLEPLRSRAVDILQPDICGTGGFTEIRRVADLAALHGVRLVPHVWGTAVQIAASLQFMAALPPDPPRQRPIDPILELDRTPNPFRQAVVTEPLEHRDGVVHVPDKPGLGIEIDRAALARFALKDHDP